MYRQYPTLIYDKQRIFDLTKSLSIVSKLKDTENFYFYFEVSAGKSPEDVSYDFYSTTEYTWLLLTFNDIRDPMHEWYIDEVNLQQKTIEKYGTEFLLDVDGNFIDELGDPSVLPVTNPTGLRGVHHYEKDDIKYKSDSPVVGSVIITNWEHEKDLNDRRQTIKVIKPEYIGQIRLEIEKKLNGRIR